jgi:glutathione synthase/RimK-type ligase-like ATP-grasp enzyme
VGEFRDALWISEYSAILRAAHKNLQMPVASRLGFRVPDTLISSDPAAARNFIATHGHGAIIVKSLSSIFPARDGEGSFFFARRISPENININLTNLHLAPAIFQQAVPTKADIRVTVIGNKLFAAKIVDDNAYQTEYAAYIRDWRLRHAKKEIKFEPFALPASVKRLCILLVEELGLQYGAIDLVIDEKNRFWFLEINPNGQWAFIEEDTDMPIGKALAVLMMSGHRN